MSRLDSEDWLRAAFELLATGGVDAVKVEPLAKQLGVTKGSFYWHFNDRPALLQALLDHWVHLDTEQIIELVDAAPDPTTDPNPAEALHRLVELTLAPTDGLDGVETAIRAWASSDTTAAAVTAEVDKRRLDYVTDLLMAAGVDHDDASRRAHLLYRVLIGEYMWRRYGGTPIDPAAVHELVDHLAS